MQSLSEYVDRSLNIFSDRYSPSPSGHQPDVIALSVSSAYPHGSNSSSTNSSAGKKEQKVLALMKLLYYVGYKYKVGGELAKAKTYLTRCKALFEKFYPQDQTIYDGCVYDLAESYFWSKDYDVAADLFRQCYERRKSSPGDVSVPAPVLVMTITAWARALMASGEPKKATPLMAEAVAYVLYSDPESGSEKDKDKDKEGKIEKFLSGSFKKKLKEIEAFSRGADLKASRKNLLEDTLQVWIDTYVGSKFYDQAMAAGRLLLAIKETDIDMNKNNKPEHLLGNFWQLGFVASGAKEMQESKRLYSSLFEKYSHSGERSRAHWYYSRGLAHDALGESRKASSDFRKADKLFGRHQKEIEADIADDYKLDVDKFDDLDYIYWLKEDLVNELRVRRKDSPSKASYIKAYENAKWPSDRFPLKVFIDRSRGHGFGEKLYEIVRDAVKVWTEIEGSPVTFKFVDSSEKADIYLERVDNYDHIPPGSAGKAEGIYIYKAGLKPGQTSGILNGVHLRVFCDTYDGDGLSSHALRHIKTLAMHEFGHALGLNHSPGGQDIMYWKADSTTLSERDKRTLKELYGRQEKVGR